MKIALSIIIPTYNEQSTIARLIRKVCSVKYPFEYEIIIVDDGSIDKTYEKEVILKFNNEISDRIRIFRNRINAGKGFSIRRGIRRAKGSIIIVQDADEEYNPNEIPALVSPILEGKAQAVYGSRFLGCRRPDGMAIANYVANISLTLFTNLLFGLHLTDMETCYKAVRADVLKTLPLKANRFAFEPEVTALLAKRGISILELPISYYGRTAKAGKKIKARDFFYAVIALVWQRILS